jgi:hypothetical protein
MVDSATSSPVTFAAGGLWKCPKGILGGVALQRCDQDHRPKNWEGHGFSRADKLPLRDVIPNRREARVRACPELVEGNLLFDRDHIGGCPILAACYDVGSSTNGISRQGSESPMSKADDLGGAALQRCYQDHRSINREGHGFSRADISAPYNSSRIIRVVNDPANPTTLP